MKPLYTNSPAAWDRAQRSALNPAEYASSIERYSPASSALGAVFKGIGILLALVAAVHLVAKVVA